MKRLILTCVFILIASTSYARDKWIGPTSSIDPMWGMKGSSIMVEALRDKPKSNPQDDPYYMVDQMNKEKELKNLKREINRLKSERGEW